jgi:hypothetical protein
MGFDPQTTTINEHKWTVTPFPARPAIRYKVRLAKMVGPAIGELIPALGNVPLIDQESDNRDDGQREADADDHIGIDLALIPKAISSMAEHVDEDMFVDTLVELMSMSTRDDTQITPEQFDIIFAGNDAELYKAIWFILKVNYSDFIGMVETAIASTGLRRMASTPAVQKTPPSTSERSKE